VQLERLGERAAKLKDPGYLQRVKEHAARTVRLGVDMVTMEKDTQKLVVQKEKDAVAAREVNPRTATFDDEAAQELARAPKSQTLVPQAATGCWNLDGKTEKEICGNLSKAVAARECEAHGLPVKWWRVGTKNAGEVHSDERLAGMIEQLKVWNGGNPLLDKLTDEDGELKSGKEYAWNIARGGSSSGLSPPIAPAAAVVTHMEEADAASAAPEPNSGCSPPAGFSPRAKRPQNGKPPKPRGGFVALPARNKAPAPLEVIGVGEVRKQSERKRKPPRG
jgi:hypothetical protein